MSWFSERKGFTRVRTEIQYDTMDETLKNRLWNLLDKYIWQKYEDEFSNSDNYQLNNLVESLWNDYYKEPIDTIPTLWMDTSKLIRARYFRSQWFAVYDFLEAIVQFSDDSKEFQKACNLILEKELSAYRFLDGKISEITSKEEISEVEEAANSPIAIVNTHLQNSLNLFSNRQSPDYRNSIKESISAVEALCRLITKNPNATLGDALNAIERQTGGTVFHPALIGAFHKFYGYTNDADGIRHAYKDDKVNSDFDEAKYMLVTCSAFVNYLISKSSKVGIKL